ncbi:MAG TPA: hypothetical protein VKP88_05720 [Candidatus Paceibacterota bacterium]|nr:hypothetical protein [Candidatus Paceibacterota bacterium]
MNPLATISEGIGYGPLASISQGYISLGEAVEAILELFLVVSPALPLHGTLSMALQCDLALSPLIGVALLLNAELQTALALRPALDVDLVVDEWEG